MKPTSRWLQFHGIPGRGLIDRSTKPVRGGQGARIEAIMNRTAEDVSVDFLSRVLVDVQLDSSKVLPHPPPLYLSLSPFYLSLLFLSLTFSVYIYIYPRTSQSTFSRACSWTCKVLNDLLFSCHWERE